ncbi:MAG: hypothetical protein HQM08_04700 [Candidatus Riflebacteria bacterium]|nr:hypothetical protein [Candidatus Riflebacteria bacterium]
MLLFMSLIVSRASSDTIISPPKILIENTSDCTGQWVSLPSRHRKQYSSEPSLNYSRPLFAWTSAPPNGKVTMPQPQAFSIRKLVLEQGPRVSGKRPNLAMDQDGGDISGYGFQGGSRPNREGSGNPGGPNGNGRGGLSGGDHGGGMFAGIGGGMSGSANNSNLFGGYNPSGGSSFQSDGMGASRFGAGSANDSNLNMDSPGNGYNLSTNGEATTDDPNYQTGFFSPGGQLFKMVMLARKITQPKIDLDLSPKLRFHAGLVGFGPGIRLQYKAVETTRLNFDIQAQHGEGLLSLKIDHLF